MSDLQLFAVTATGVQPLPVAPTATDLADLVQGLALGVYSSLRTFRHNQFLDLADHLARTVRSMQLLHWAYALDEAALRRALHTVCTAAPWPESRVRIDILAEPAAALGTASRVLIGLQAFQPPPEKLYTTGVTVGFAAGLARPQPLIKQASFVEARKGYEVGTSALYEQLLVNASGQILEGLSSNFYAVCAGVIQTAGAGVLEGITRKILLGLVTQLGLPLQLAAVHVDEVSELTEAALSSSSRGLMPVVNIAGQVIGNGQPGPLFNQVRAAYNEFVSRASQPAI